MPRNTRRATKRKSKRRATATGGGIVSVDALGMHFNLHPRRIQQLTKEGLPKLAKNEYPLLECLDWYVRYLQRALENKGASMASGDVTLWQKEKSRALTVSAELKELDLAQKRGQLVTVADAAKALEDFAHMVKARINAVPPRLAAAVVGETSRVMVQALIEKELRGAMTLIASDGSNLEGGSSAN